MSHRQNSIYKFNYSFFGVVAPLLMPDMRGGEERSLHGRDRHTMVLTLLFAPDSATLSLA